MTVYNPNADTIRAEIEQVADTGESVFLTDFYGKTLDGSDVAAYMRSIGFEVIRNFDTGRYGRTELAIGVVVSTNGACTKIK